MLTVVSLCYCSSIAQANNNDSANQPAINDQIASDRRYAIDEQIGEINKAVREMIELMKQTNEAHAVELKLIADEQKKRIAEINKFVADLEEQMRNCGITLVQLPDGTFILYQKKDEENIVESGEIPNIDEVVEGSLYPAIVKQFRLLATATNKEQQELPAH
ncbi:MAG: hypothetical protein LBT03_02840 [Holosporales bacterium]|nr:hypothetical protein [Holosporales bacterium]